MLIRKLFAVLTALALLAAVPAAFAANEYAQDGTVYLENAEGERRQLQIAEILEAEDGVTVYVSGSADFNVYITTIDFMTGGMVGRYNIRAWMEDAEGNRIEPAEVHGFIGTADSGNTASFRFESGTEYKAFVLALRSNAESEIVVPLEDLQLSEDTKISDKIVTLK